MLLHQVASVKCRCVGMCSHFLALKTQRLVNLLTLALKSHKHKTCIVTAAVLQHTVHAWRHCIHSLYPYLSSHSSVLDFSLLPFLVKVNTASSVAALSPEAIVCQTLQQPLYSEPIHPALSQHRRLNALITRLHYKGIGSPLIDTVAAWAFKQGDVTDSNLHIKYTTDTLAVLRQHQHFELVFIS